MKAEDAVTAGAKPTPTDRTVAHWYGTTVNRDNGVTYGYNMVGADPNTLLGRRVLDHGPGGHHAARS